MSPETRGEMKERTLLVLEAFGVVIAYFAILAALLYPVLQGGGYLS